MSRIALVLIGLSLAGNAFAQGGAIRLTLADAISRGLDTSHRIAEIKAREEGALAAVKGAEVAKRPIVSASAGYFRTNHVDEFSVPQPNGSLVVVYPDIPDNFVSRVGFSVADLHIGTHRRARARR